MTRQSLHAHCTFDDGGATPEQMVRAAIGAGLGAVGLSLHSPIPGEEDWCARPENIPEFQAEIHRLAAVYRDEIAVYCGLEYDLCSEPDFGGFAYVIASVHELVADGRRWSVDDTRARAKELIDGAYGGDGDAAAQAYFAAVARIAALPEADVVGHFDLLTKFDEPEPLYHTDSRVYRAAALDAMERLVCAGKIFEINTGAAAKGYRTAFYPSEPLLRALREMGGKITISSDAHAADQIAFGFPQAEALARRCGFTALWQFNGRAFEPTEF